MSYHFKCMLHAQCEHDGNLYVLYKEQESFKKTTGCPCEQESLEKPFNCSEIITFSKKKKLNS